MAGDLDIQRARDLFGTCDLDGSGYIDKQELAAVCDLDAEDLGEVFNQLDADRDGRISIEEFSENFMKFKNVVSGIKQKRLTRTATGDDLEDFRQRLGKSYELISGQEYVSELFHYMHNSNDSAQLLSLLESFLFSVVRDVKHYSSENAKLEEALKRACEKHAEHMEQLDDELDQQMSRLEMRIKKEEQSKFERSNLDMVWQLETKNKEIQALNAKVSKLENKIKKKEPEEQKLKEEIEEKVQELRYLRSQVTDAQTTVAVIRSELAQLKNDYEDQSSQLEAEKRNVMECVQEQESLTRQLQLLHEANKKLHDTNDDLRSALEMRRGSEGGKSPSPSKRNSISTLYSTVPRAHRRSKSHEPSSRRASNLTGEFSGDDRHPNSASASTPRSSVAAPPPEGSRRSSMLLPTQQSCEVDDPVNEDSLLSELMKVQRSHESPFDTQSTSSDAESVEHDYNHNAGILNAKETGRIHHLIPPARQSCEVESKGSPEDTIDPVVHRYEHAVHSGSHSSGSQSLPGDEVLDWDQVLKRVREIEEAGTCSLGGETDVSEESRVTVEEPALKRVKEAVESGDESIFEVDDDTNEETAQAAVSRPSKRIEDDHVDESGEYPNGEKQAKEPDVDRVPCIVLEEDSESDGGIDEVMSAKSSQRDEGIYPGSTEDQHVVSDSETVDDSNEFDIKSEEPYPANNLATSKETSFLNTTPEECIDKGKGSDEEARLEPVFSPRVNVGTGDSTPRVLLDPDIELFEKGEEPEYYTVFETEPVHERFERMKEIGLKRCPAFVRPGTRPLSERYRKTTKKDSELQTDETTKDTQRQNTDTTASDKTDDEPTVSSHDSSPRTQKETGLTGLSVKLGRYIKKNVSIKSKERLVNRTDKDTSKERNGMLKDTSRQRTETDADTRRSFPQGVSKKNIKDSTTNNEKEERSIKHVNKLTRSSSERSKTRTANAKDLKRSKSSVTFASAVSADKLQPRIREKGVSGKSPRHRKHVTTDSETTTSDTDSTPRDLKLNFPDGTEEEDEAYSTMPSSERESLRQQLDLLQKTNNDLRTALEVVVGKTRSPSSKGKRRSERGEKCRRNASIKSTHSDYGSISSRSMSPSRSHGAKSGEDIADGAEELSGYDPESDGNNTSTITLQSRHEEAPPIPAKLGATQHERIKIAGRETNDVIWEDEDEAETERPAGSDGFKRADDNSPFKRNSILRKPCRHRSLETLDEGEGPTGRGNRSAWPPIARAGKWHSMEQVKRRNDFAGERTRSLPHLRTQSADRLDFSTGEGLTQLAEKLNALQKSAEDVKAQTPPNKVTDREAPAPPVPQEDLTSAKSYRMEEERRALREIIAPLIRPVPAPRTRKSAHVEPQEDQTQQRHPVIESPRHTSKTLPRGSVVTRIKQSESLPDSDLSRADISELEAQFKSVIKEDEEDIDEDDVDDEELAQLVAMATGLTDSEEETETEDDDTTVGVREAAVGADSISEASTNTALNMSNVDERVPERMFKIVLAGDAAVGKSSFILRLCRNRFHSALNSTLGVDFQMKTLVVDGKTYALQLWDTAGQERFRSIAKSYFRKADGVLLLYDVTCETSFLDVRDWVEAIEESCSKPVPIMLCGNKIDIRQSAAAENKTVITAESGSRLAKEHGALFIETSSKENKNIAEACIELARMLRDVEDIEVKQNNGMKLTDNDIKKKKTNCCST
ncbi:myosin-6 isoform X3 [Nematostella vectensis]|uniref:myosin-6 isoform X3 n=1 Tax=Nematostella vectensis TaxID=45351 RepID=UPI0020776946|nr:myosin-6 isoform X3 [Nematostella vectensis]